MRTTSGPRAACESVQDETASGERAPLLKKERDKSHYMVIIAPYNKTAKLKSTSRLPGESAPRWRQRRKAAS